MSGLTAQMTLTEPPVRSPIDPRLIWDRLDESWRVWLEEHEEDDIDRPLPKCNRGSWFCPVVSIIDAEMIRKLAFEYSTRRIYDMGAGDLRLSYYLYSLGFDVIAYESMPDQPRRAASILGPPPFPIRRDYYLDFPMLTKQRQRALFCFMGGTNHAPSKPKGSLVVEGYWEVGTRFYKDGVLTKKW